MFLHQVKQAGGSDAWFVDALCASAEYESFVELMEGMLALLGCGVVDCLELSSVPFVDPLVHDAGMVSEHYGSGGPVEGSFRAHIEQDMTGGIELQESTNK